MLTVNLQVLTTKQGIDILQDISDYLLRSQDWVKGRSASGPVFERLFLNSGYTEMVNSELGLGSR